MQFRRNYTDLFSQCWSELETTVARSIESCYHGNILLEAYSPFPEPSSFINVQPSTFCVKLGVMAWENEMDRELVRKGESGTEIHHERIL